MVPDLAPPDEACTALCESVVGSLLNAAVVVRALAPEPRQSAVPRTLRPFGSLGGYFAAVRELVARLEADGLREAADELAAGYRELNGLTDGWALFLDSVERVRRKWGGDLTAADRRRLAELRAFARRAVGRR